MLPPGPFVPHGDAPDGVIDLGIRVRDQLLRSEIVAGGVRQVLSDRLGAVAQSGRLALSPGLLDSVLHTWPLAAMLDDAVKTWKQGPDPVALSVVARAMYVVSSALGWPMTIDRTWPMPDPEWILREAGAGPHVVHSRGPRDGAPAVAAVLRAPLGAPRLLELPPVIVGQGDELAANVDAWIATIQAGDAVAVRFETPVPWDRETRAALKRLHAASKAQLAMSRYGHAALFCPDVPEFETLLGTAPAGKPSERPKARCDALVVPHVDDDGRTAIAGALCWDAPYAPAMVHPFAIEVLEKLDGTRTVAQAAKELDAGEQIVESIVRQLTDIGAL